MHLRRDERGASLLEFALILPVFILIVGAMFSLLWIVGAKAAISGAARDAARYASIRHDPLTCEPSPCDSDWPTETEVADYATQRAGRFGVDHVTVVRPTAPNAPVSVTVDRKLPVIFRTIGSLFHTDGIEYTSTGKARAE